MAELPEADPDLPPLIWRWSSESWAGRVPELGSEKITQCSSARTVRFNT